MDSIIRLNAQTNGRDKLIRLAYYSCILAKNLIKQEDQFREQSIVRIEKLEEILDLTRKILNFGRAIDVFNSTLNSLSIKDTVFQLTISLSRISVALFLLMDHMVLLKRLNLINRKNTHTYVNLGQRFLLFGLTLNLTRDLYEINNFINTYKSKKRNVLHKSQVKISNESSNKEVELTWAEYYYMFTMNKHITADTIKNLFDFLICYSNLQKADQKYNPKLISLFGITSSILGLLPIIRYSYRIFP